jgi:hypothetical protein
LRRPESETRVSREVGGDEARSSRGRADHAQEPDVHGGGHLARCVPPLQAHLGDGGQRPRWLHGSQLAQKLSALRPQLSALRPQLSALSSQAALKHTAKCRLLRGRFLHYNVMTERMEYLHVTSSTREVFTRQWNLISNRAVRKDLLDEAR